MFKFVVLAGVVLSAAAMPTIASQSEVKELFKTWKTQWGKNYATTEEEALRLAIFGANLEHIITHNNQNLSWRAGVNEFTDLTPTEFGFGRIGGFKRPSLRGPAADTAVDASALPKSIDWVQKGAVTPVKNQQQCGSSWAFSATGAVEGINEINGHGLISLSEQQLMDCSGTYGNYGCNGGFMDSSFQYIQANGGICSERAYPYTGVQGNCSTACTPVVKINGYKDVKPSDDAAFVTALAQQPLSICIESDQQLFQYYTSGVITGACGKNCNHGILAVGYGEENGVQYFKLKNQWGASWGEAGYVRIGRGEKYNGGAGQCGVYLTPSYPTQA